jgi:hypothetical protein
MRTFLTILILALAAVVICIALSPNKPSEDWRRFRNGGIEAPPRPSPSGKPRRLTDRERRDNRKQPIAQG